MQLTPDKVGKSIVFYRHRHVAFAFEKALSGQMFELVNICMDFFLYIVQYCFAAHLHLAVTGTFYTLKVLKTAEI